MTTSKQENARHRNWLIFRLRGLYGLSNVLTTERGDEVRKLIDAELLDYKAESETTRRDKIMKAWFQ